ncbi:low-specificity L-threonine aldolase [Parachlamydia acanthamoebae]|uniref:low-specificity L-threonine aldolase n=1 Tax=Parachlamydia acanthamoebae TaxID=83552 RepID=UPI000751715B|nr:low-specificity L-threonine aldolase [Parachlamydia acanthamoebae]
MKKKEIDLISDTVTQPTPSMIYAMQHAITGDDVYGEDPTINALEKRSAEILGKENACFLPSGTMANLTSILAHCPRGYEALVGDESDIFLFEAGGASVLGGVAYHPVKTEQDGTLSVKNLENSLKDLSDFQFARTRLICIENPHNLRGGRVLPLSYLKDVYNFSKKNHLSIHMDGARIFNASIALGISALQIASFADSVQFCLSKSLAAPAGSVVVGSASFIDEVRRLRKMLGGGMRQIGYLGAAGLVALEEMIPRLSEDHKLAKQLAAGLTKIKGIHCDLNEVETNMVYFELKETEKTNHEFLAELKQHSIRMSCLGGRIRAAIHYHISQDDVEIILETIKKMTL